MTRLNFREILTALLVLIHVLHGSSGLLAQNVAKQGPAVPVNFCVSAGEMELHKQVNDYRKHYGLPPIPLSKSLSYVASLHAKDLFLNHPEAGPCNSHSWSNKGFWLPFCYPGDENKKNSVWDKPRELTKYPSRAYEIVYWENNPLSTDTVIMVWQMEEYFNSFLLNTGKWQGKTWNAVGIGVYENYACAWFGEVHDPECEVIVCGSVPVRQVKKDSVPEKVPTAAVPKDSSSVKYYIIVKTNLSLNASTKLVGALKTDGYQDAKVLEKDGKIRVSVFESPDRATVTAKLKEVKKTYKDAWLLKK